MRGDEMWQFLTRYFWQLFAIALIVVIIIASHVFIPHKKNVAEVQPTQLLNTKEVAKSLDVKPKTAKQIQHAIIEKEKPVEKYYASNTQQVVKHEESKRKENKADKVVVTETSDKSVDVYRITLKKEHKIKVGATVLDDKLYPSVGYQAGRVEGIAHFEGTKVKGVTVMYTIKEW